MLSNVKVKLSACLLKHF